MTFLLKTMIVVYFHLFFFFFFLFGIRMPHFLYLYNRDYDRNYFINFGVANIHQILKISPGIL